MDISKDLVAASATSLIDRLERWQMACLPVYSAWAAFVVIVFPPLFGFK
jgi:hypothetical protein